jgi:TatD DNase family protein
MGRPRPLPPRLPGLVDAHCHLDYPPMADDVAATLAAARAVGVEQVLHVGCTRQSQPRALALVDAHPEVFAALGIHPHEAKTTDDAALAELRARAAHPKVLAIGETGLDYHYNLSTPEEQRASLRAHVALARALELPLVLHIREAHDEALAIVQEVGPRPQAPGMVHCFTGGPRQAEAWLALGFHISYSGIATFPNAAPIREAVQLTPADRILLETDAPYLSPVPVRGTKNEPAHVAFTCACLAQIRGEDPQALARQAAANTRALLRMPAAPPPA